MQAVFQVIANLPSQSQKKRLYLLFHIEICPLLFLLPLTISCPAWPRPCQQQVRSSAHGRGGLEKPQGFGAYSQQKTLPED